MPSRNFLSASIPAWVFGFGLREAASASHETPWRIPRKRSPPSAHQRVQDRLDTAAQHHVRVSDDAGGYPGFSEHAAAAHRRDAVGELHLTDRPHFLGPRSRYIELASMYTVATILWPLPVSVSKSSSKY